jgi:hypothetical protein
MWRITLLCTVVLAAAGCSRPTKKDGESSVVAQSMTTEVSVSEIAEAFRKDGNTIANAKYKGCTVVVKGAVTPAEWHEVGKPGVVLSVAGNVTVGTSFDVGQEGVVRGFKTDQVVTVRGKLVEARMIEDDPKHQGWIGMSIEHCELKR